MGCLLRYRYYYRRPLFSCKDFNVPEMTPNRARPTFARGQATDVTGVDNVEGVVEKGFMPLFSGLKPIYR